MTAGDRIDSREAQKTATAVGAAGAESPQKLMEGCQGLVKSLAWKIHRKLPPQVDLDDLIAFGQVGLAEAARNFDPARGGKFITYAYYRIRGAIFDGLCKMSWFSRHDYHASRYERMAGEVVRLEDEDAEEAAAGSEADARWLEGVSSSLVVVYLATSRWSGEDGGVSEPVADESTASPSNQAMEQEMEEKLRGFIDALPGDARTLIRGVYYEGLTLTEAGMKLGISKAWASRLHAKTLRRLAHALRLAGLGE
jgi:RNA polymerase sigma factor for flagellar operon FliA